MLTVLLALFGMAADDVPPRVRQEIVVTADRAPTARDELTTAASVVDVQTIAAAPARTAADLLTLTPGVAVFGAGSTAPATIAVRGFYGGGEVEYVQLRVDGVPAGDVESGLAPWQQFRVEELERVEVARGMESALYGDTAVGGVVQLFTRRGADGDSEASAGGGSFASGDLAAALWRDRFALFADGSTAGSERPHSGAQRSALRATWSGAAGGNRLLSLVAERRQSDRDDPGPLPLAEVGERVSDPLYRRDDDHAVRERAAASLEWPGWLAAAHVSSKSGRGVRTILLFPPSFADSTDRTIDSREGGASVQLSRGGWRVGGDAAAQRFSATYFDVGGSAPIASTSAHRDVLAAYATRRVALGAHAALAGGVRIDSIRNRDSRDHAWSPRLALHVNGGGVTGYVGASSGFKAPTIEQLYDVRPLRAFGRTFTLANPALVPQRARSIEGGLARGTAVGRWQADAYVTRVADEIDFDPRTFRYGNISRSEHRGVEAAFEPAAAARFQPRLTYTWMRVYSLDDPARAQLKNIPEHSVSAMVSTQLPMAVEATALFAWNGRRWLDDAESIAAPDTRALSVRLQRAAGAATVRLDVLNATGAHNAALGFVLADLRGNPFAYAYPDAPRSFRLSVAWKRHAP